MFIFLNIYFINANLSIYVYVCTKGVEFSSHYDMSLPISSDY